MGVNQDVGGYSLNINNNPDSNYSNLFDQYTSDGTLTVSVYFEDSDSYVDMYVGGVLIPSSVTTYDPVSEKYVADISYDVEAGSDVEFEFFSPTNLTVNFGEFNMPSGTNDVFLETFSDGAFDNVWATNTLGDDLTTNDGALTWSFSWSGGSDLTLVMLAAFAKAVDYHDIAINHKAWMAQPNNPPMFLYLLGQTGEPVAKLSDEGRIYSPYMVSDEITKVYPSNSSDYPQLVQMVDDMVYGIGYFRYMQAF